MKLRVINSGSAANGYLLTDNEGNTLIVEAGCKILDYNKALDFDYSRVLGCVVSHEHQDHSRAVADLQRKGVEVYCSNGTFAALQNVFRCNVITAEKKQSIGQFVVSPFRVIHDAAEPFGFVISHPEMGNCLFATDTSDIPYYYNGLNQIIIEANYDENILDNRPAFLAERIAKTHLSINKCIDYLSNIELGKVQNILLVHLSNSNSDAVGFQKTIQQLTNKKVYCAVPDLNIPFNITPF